VIGPRDLRGLWGFALTPFAGDGIDEVAYRAGVRGLVEGRADVVIAAGTLGQGDRMTAEERRRCVAVAANEVVGAVPVLGVIVADETAGTAAAALVDAGADGALVLPMSGEPSSMAASVDAIGRATGGALPVVVYQRGDLRFEPGTLRELAERPSMIGLKDAHGDLRRFRRLREAVGDRLVWVGASEDLAVAYRTHGADAVSPASLAYQPAYARRYWAALDDGDVTEAVRLLRGFAWPVTDLRYSRPDIEISVVREFARVFGHAVGDLRRPAQALDDAEVREVGRLAAGLDSLLAGA
jgi:5-dehydro-4-deoxyglucarate dehydratase